MEKTVCASSMSNGNGKTADSGLQITRRQSNKKYGKLTWFDTRVFYVKISDFADFAVSDGCIPEYLTLNHVPVNAADTFLEINGLKCCTVSKGFLRRNKSDSKNEEATFVSTDCIRFTGSVKFEVTYKEDVIISGILEMSNSHGVSENGESKNSSNNNNDTRKWSLNCDVVKSPRLEFLKGGKTGRGVSENISPTIEVYVAGCVSGFPIILTKTLRLKKNGTLRSLNSIPESGGGGGGGGGSGSQEPIEPRVVQVKTYTFKNQFLILDHSPHYSESLS